ncbi:hypothetical protein Tco_0369138 [Tanacetum coccineum]
MASPKASISKPSMKPKFTSIPPKQLFIDLTNEDTITPSPKLQESSPSALNSPSKTPSTKDTSSSSIDYTLKSPTLSSSPSTNGYLNPPLSPPSRVPPPPPTQAPNLMEITLSLSPITLLDVHHNSPLLSPPIIGHPIPWNLLKRMISKETNVIDQLYTQDYYIVFLGDQAAKQDSKANTHIGILSALKRSKAHNLEARELSGMDVTYTVLIKLLRIISVLQLSADWVLKKFNYFDCTPVSTPMDTSEKLMPNKGQDVSQLEYSRLIGCLMYAMTCTRHDIAFDVGKLSRYTSNPGTQHWQANQLVFLLGGDTISWAFKKQTCITGSTMESEFVALAAAGKEAECAAILAKAYSQMYNGKFRHLGVRHSMIFELITNVVVSIEFVSSQQNLADHLTKGLTKDLAIKYAEGMGFVTPPFLHIAAEANLGYYFKVQQS